MSTFPVCRQANAGSEVLCDFPKVTYLARKRQSWGLKLNQNSELRLASLNLADTPSFAQQKLVHLQITFSPKLTKFGPDNCLTATVVMTAEPMTTATSTVPLLTKGHLNCLHFRSSQPTAGRAGLWLGSSFYGEENHWDIRKMNFVLGVFLKKYFDNFWGHRICRREPTQSTGG